MQSAFKLATFCRNMLLALVSLALVESSLVVSGIVADGTSLAGSVEDGCPKLSGTYDRYGESLPGMVPYFRIKGIKLALDTMLGLDLKVPDRQLLQIIDLEDSNGVKLMLRGSATESWRTLDFLSTDRVWCRDRTLFIERKMGGRGEAVTGTATILHSLSFSDSGYLVLKTEIKSLSKFLFFDITNPPEFYGAQFRRIN